MTIEEVVAQMASELAQLRQKVEELEQRPVAQTSLRSPTPPTPPTPLAAPGATPVDPGGALSRRNALRAMGAAGLAVGTGLATAAVLATSAEPAAAANGNGLTLGSNANAATSPTGLEVSGGTEPYGLAVTDNGLSSIPAALFNPSILGHAQDMAFNAGVCGYNAATHPGVIGYSVGGSGVYAMCAGSAEAFLGESIDGVGIAVRGGQAAVFLELGNITPPPQRTGGAFPGMIDIDFTGTVWLCVEGPSSTVWVRLGAPGGAGVLTVLPASVRVYDSRINEPPATVGPKTPLVADTPREIDMTANDSGVPPTANAVLVNATAIPDGHLGYLALYKAGIAYPGTSTLTWSATGGDVANSATVALSGGKINARVSTTANLVVDVIGYYL